MPITPKPLQIEVYCRDCGTSLEAQWSPMSRIKNDGSEAGLSIEPCQCPLNEIRKVYEKHKPEPKWYTSLLASDLWQAIKASVERPEPLPDGSPTETSTDRGRSVL